MKNRRKMRQKRNHSVAWGAIVSVIAVCLIAFGAYQGLMAIMDSWLEDLPSVENTDAFNYSRKTRIYASDETTLLAEFYIENREPVTIDQVSPYVLEGTVATEDERFYEHNGVDPYGIARAFVVNITGSSREGASTITMQFVRNTILSSEATDISLKRKVREAELATQLEGLYSKDEILMMYLNTINYGDGAYGIESASKNYFQKHANELTIAEAATLIGIPQSPTYLNPKTNPDACLERRNLVLSRMLEYGTITEEEYEAAKAEELILNPADDSSDEGIYAYPYFTSYVRQLLLSEYPESDIFQDGLTVYTTIDPNIQNKAEAAAQAKYETSAEDIEVSLTAIDPQTGYIKALIGGRNYGTNKYNLATQGLRQAGSTFKMFTLVTAIEQGIDPDTKIDCTSPMTIGNDTFQNYGNINYGIRSIQSATAVSSNTGFVRLADEVGVPLANQTARRMGITTEDLHDYRSSTLGAVNVTSLEMASSYATLAASGVQRDPVAITKIVSWNGDVVFEHEDNPTRVLTEDVAGAATDVLKTIFTDSEATAYGYGLSDGRPAAGKTGTSSNNYDKWLCGYTPQLSTAVWVGVASENRDIGDFVNANDVWKNFMDSAHEGLEIVDFPSHGKPPYSNDFNKKQKEAYEKPDIEDAPSVVGMTLEEAGNALDGFEAVYYEEYSSTVAAGLVIRQEVVDGKLVLYVSKGPDPADAVEPDPEKPEEPTEESPTDPPADTDP